MAPLASVKDMWHALKDWVLDLRNGLDQSVAQSELGKALRGLNHDIKQSQSNYWHHWEIVITHYFQSYLLFTIYTIPSTSET